MLLVLACRPDEAGAERSLARIATDSLARRLTPRALSPQGAAALLADALGRAPEEAFTATCHEVSGGNPFLLCELARTLADRGDRPRRRAGVARARAGAGAGDAHRAAAPRAALARRRGRSRGPSSCSATAPTAGSSPSWPGSTRRPWRAAPTSCAPPRSSTRTSTLRFIHPLVRTALDAELPIGERAAAHARAAELLRARGASAAAAGRAPGRDRGARRARDGRDAAGGRPGGAGQRRSALGATRT